MITFTQLGKMGRLGNQLFQIACVIATAERNGDQYCFPTWEYERYFNLHGCFSDNIRPNKIYQEPYFHYSEIPHFNTNGSILDLNGYFQSWRYFENSTNTIRALLTPKKGYGIKYDYTSVHVRRGDYVNNPAYHQLTMEYYKEAMEIAKSKHYVILSDDIAWCRKNFVGEQFIFSEGKHPTDDLALMIACENNILSNSSFSFWGAYLNKLPSKVIVAPQKWFGPALSHDVKDVLIEGWIKI